MDTPYNFVSHIIGVHGPRRAGSQAEKLAQHFLAEELNTFCDRVEVQPFVAALTAKFGSLRIFSLLYVAALMLPVLSLPLALAVAAVNGAVFMGHFVMTGTWLDFLFPKEESCNVVGTIEPTGPARRTLLFAGHMDSTPEFIWWYWFKDWGIRMMMVSGVSFLLLPIYYAVAWPLGAEVWLSAPWWGFVAASPFALTFFFIHGTRVVEGAQDNLSGVAVAHAVGKRLAKERLSHTRIVVVSFGAEETGLKGSAAMVERFGKELQATPHHLINLDGILDIHNMFVIRSELSIGVTHDNALVARVAEAFERNGLPPKLGTIPVGGTDASSFSRNGLSAMSIVGLPMDSLHPTYHTRLDTIDCLTPSTMDRMVDVLVDMAHDWDSKE
ncbi:MAG: Zn-dependent exopeptidase M28 [Flavobacteriales bacterium]|nr:Zn-dependent exopeptidase M28 [Flavobacteriales bacterium]